MFFRKKRLIFLFLCISKFLGASNLVQFRQMCENRELVNDASKPLLNYLINSVYENNNYDYDLEFVLNHYKRQTKLVITNDNSIKDLSILSEFTHLEELYLLDLKNIKDLSPLASLVNLKKLAIHHSSKVEDISCFENMYQLEDLSLFGTSVKNIAVLSDKINLTRLDLYKNPIQDVENLLLLTKFTYLSFNSTSIDFEYVLQLTQNNPKLKRLDIRNLNFTNNQILEIESLDQRMTLSY